MVSLHLQLVTSEGAGSGPIFWWDPLLPMGHLGVCGGPLAPNGTSAVSADVEWAFSSKNSW